MQEKTKPGSGTLKHGLMIAGELQKSFAVRDGTMVDYFAAEDIADINKPLSFDAALLIQRLENIGTFTGPFTLEILARLKPGDFAMLRKALREAENAGESEPAPVQTG